MRLQLRHAAFFVLASCSSAAAERVSVRTDVYTDELLTVLSPSARMSLEANERWTTVAEVSVDILSGATPAIATDVISSATSFDETRLAARSEVSFSPERSWKVRALAGVSSESDYRSHGFGAGAETDVFDRSATLACDYALALDRIGRADDPAYTRKAQSHTLDLRWTQIVTRRMTLELLGSGELEVCDPDLGCRASPYRSVPLTDPGTKVIVLRPAERHPSTAWSAANAIRVAYAVNRDLALHAGYRFFASSWDITAHTADVAAALSSRSEDFVLRAEGRVHWQSAASFYRDEYRVAPGATTIPGFRSADRDLSGMYDFMTGVRVARRTSGRSGGLELSARAARVWYRYRDYSGYPERNAWLFGVGASAEF